MKVFLKLMKINIWGYFCAHSNNT